MITFADFQKLDLRVAKVLKVEEIEASAKLLKLQVDLGSEKRQILAGIKQYYHPGDLEGQEIVIVANLEPKTILGEESQGMLLAADQDGVPILLQPDRKVKPGSKIK